MKYWRVVVITLSFLLLSGCLVSFKQAMPASEAAPAGLLGKWTSKNAWGEAQNLDLTRVGPHRYQAVSYFKAKPKEREAYPFTVARHGNRWYLSAGVPKRLGGNFLIGGFEVIDGKELVVYNLDVEQVQQAVEKKELTGRSTEVPEDNGEGVLIDSPSARVLAYLDDPANSDLFVEVARFQRSGK